MNKRKDIVIELSRHLLCELLSSAFRMIAYAGIYGLELRRRRKCETYRERLHVSLDVEVVWCDTRFRDNHRSLTRKGERAGR